MWIYYIIQLQFKRVFVPQFMWEMFVKRQWSIPSNPCNKSGIYLNHLKWLEIAKSSIFLTMIILRDHSYITSVHFWTFLDPPTLCSSQIILRSNILRHHFYLPKVIIQVKNSNGGLKRLVPCLKCMELACWVLQASLNLYYCLR